MTVMLQSGVKLTPKSDEIAEQLLRNMPGAMLITEQDKKEEEEEKPQKTRAKKSAE